MIEQGDILLVPFPFSDQSGRKVRPVVIISKNDFNESSEDVIAVGVTSNISKDIYSVIISDNDLEEGKLFAQSCIKVENILKLDRGLIIKKIGRISKKKLAEIFDKLDGIFK